MKHGLAVVAVAAGALTLPANPAWASDESFEVSAIGGCGSARLFDVDSMIDDYVTIYDHCDDGMNVYAAVWEPLSFAGADYNRNGPSGPPVTWYPFDRHEDGQCCIQVQLEVCLTNPADDLHWYNCAWETQVIDP